MTDDVQEARDVGFGAFALHVFDELSPAAQLTIDRLTPPSQLIRDVLWAMHREKPDFFSDSSAGLEAAERAMAPYDASSQIVTGEILALIETAKHWK